MPLTIEQLQKLVTNVLCDVETDSFLQEVHMYNVDTLPTSSAAVETPSRIGHWWTKDISETGKYQARFPLPCCRVSMALG